MDAELSDLKYVVVYSQGLEIPVLAPQLRRHCDLVGTSSTVVSAGFCRLLPDEAAPGD